MSQRGGQALGPVLEFSALPTETTPQRALQDQFQRLEGQPPI
jgi:hypothetical protein